MKPDRALVALLSLFVFAVAHAVVATLDVPVALYDPASGAWSFGRHAPGFMGYYGEALWAVLAAGLTAVVVGLSTRGRTASRCTLDFVAWAALVAVLADFIALALVSARGA